MTRQEEKAIAIQVPASDLVLDGIFIRGGDPEPAGAVIAPPHPLFGGSMASPVLGELAYACKQAGYASIRFDWRGVGASAGSASGEAADADADYRAALAYLEETVPGPLVAAGYSFGAAAALRVAGLHPRVRRLLLVAPPIDHLDREALAKFRGSALIVAGARDALSPVSALEEIAGDDPRRRVERIAEADHFFGVGLAELGRVAASWLGAPRRG
ncbi:MAG TPA: alpha/beta fold hydrolase [Myxococcota bacterium]